MRARQLGLQFLSFGIVALVVGVVGFVVLTQGVVDSESGIAQVRTCMANAQCETGDPSRPLQSQLEEGVRQLEQRAQWRAIAGALGAAGIASTVLGAGVLVAASREQAGLGAPEAQVPELPRLTPATISLVDPATSPRVCAKCGHKSGATAAFCASCGASLSSSPARPSACASCGSKLSATSRFCEACGAPVGKIIARDDMWSREAHERR